MNISIIDNYKFTNIVVKIALKLQENGMISRMTEEDINFFGNSFANYAPQIVTEIISDSKYEDTLHEYVPMLEQSVRECSFNYYTSVFKNAHGLFSGDITVDQIDNAQWLNSYYKIFDINDDAVLQNYIEDLLGCLFEHSLTWISQESNPDIL